MSTFLHIDYTPNRHGRPDQRAGTTIDDSKQAVSSSPSIPGRSLLNRNTSVSDILASLPTPPAWHIDTPCSQADPECFFPEKGESTANAKRICAGCDVREQCLEWALDNRERFGVFGGLSERERRPLLEQRDTQAATGRRAAIHFDFEEFELIISSGTPAEEACHRMGMTPTTLIRRYYRAHRTAPLPLTTLVSTQRRERRAAS